MSAARLKAKAPSVPKAPPSWSPDQPHPEPAVEEFCADLATGLAATDSYILHFEAALEGIDPDSSSVRARAHRLQRRPDVEARILHIRMARRKPVEALSEADLSRLMVEVTDTLAEAHRSAEEAGAHSSDLAALRKAITTHVGRAGRMRPAQAVPFDASGVHKNLVEMLGAVPLCACHENPHPRASEDPEAIDQRGAAAMAELSQFLDEEDRTFERANHAAEADDEYQ